MGFLYVTQTLQTIADLLMAVALCAIAINEVFGSNGWRQRGRSSDDQHR